MRQRVDFEPGSTPTFGATCACCNADPGARQQRLLLGGRPDDKMPTARALDSK